MADVATPSTAQVATADATAAPQGKQQFVRPEKPDEEKYKEDLAKAEKAHTVAQEKLVNNFMFPVVSFRLSTFKFANCTFTVWDTDPHIITAKLPYEPPICQLTEYCASPCD
jgi:hypothetical protein